MCKCEGCTGCTVEDKVVKIGDKYSNQKESVISCLHEIQDLYGYIPDSVQKYISDKLKVPLSEIYGIITFYSRFSLLPKGKYNIQVCMGTACYVKGSEEIINEFKDILKISEGQTTEDGMFSIEAVRCIGACGLAPAIVVNEEVYGKVKKDMVKGIVEKYKSM
jgi:NADP-reducing hydrogenase subunit HndA